MSHSTTAIGPVPAWPALPEAAWVATRQTLHMWTQIVGKTRLALCPRLNHWWQVPLYVTPRGLSTGPMPYAAGSCEVVFDFVGQCLRLHTSNGQAHTMPLEPRSVADFYHHYRALLREAGIEVKMWPVPVEVPDTTTFPDNHHLHLTLAFRVRLRDKKKPAGWAGLTLGNDTLKLCLLSPASFRP